MLHILLMILKIFGIIILIILGIVLTVLLLILLVPIRYELKSGVKNDYRTFKANADVRWLYKLLHVQVKFKDMRLAWRIKVLWFTVLQEGFELPDNTKERVKKHERNSREDYDEDEAFERELAKLEAEYVSEQMHGDAEEREGSADSGREDLRTETELHGNSESGENPADIGEVQTDSESGEREDRQGKDSERLEQSRTECSDQGGSDEGSDGNTEESGEGEGYTGSEDKEEISEETEKTEEDTSEEEKETGEESKSISEKITGVFKNISEKIREINEKKEKIKELLTNKDHRKALRLLKDELWKIIRHYIPRKADIRLVYGFDDPYYTGLLTSVLAVLYALSTGHIYGEPHFEEKILSGRVDIKGHVRLIWLVFAAIRLVLSRAVRTTYHDIRNFEL